MQFATLFFSLVIGLVSLVVAAPTSTGIHGPTIFTRIMGLTWISLGFETSDNMGNVDFTMIGDGY